MSDTKAEILRIVMEEYNKVRIRNTLFFETWENSITGGIINHIRKLLRKGPVLCRVVVQLSEEDLLREKGKSINAVSLDACKSGSMGGLFGADVKLRQQSQQCKNAPNEPQSDH